MNTRAKSISPAVRSDDPEIHVAGKDPPPDLVGASEAAKLLGISVGEFQRRRRAGYYEQAGVDERGYRWYDRAYLERRKRELPVVRRRDLRQKLAGPENHDGAGATPAPSRTFGRAYGPETAAAVFDELAIDEDLVRIVKKLVLHPEVVRAVHAEWLVLRQIGGGYHVSGDQAREIARLELDGFPCASGEELLAALRCMAELRDPCAKCARRPRRNPLLCAPCEGEARDRERAEIAASAKGARA